MAGPKHYCPGSGTADYVTRSYHTGLLAKCDRCGRVLKVNEGGVLRKHQERGKTTASHDKTMEILWGMDEPPYTVADVEAWHGEPLPPAAPERFNVIRQFLAERGTS